MDMKNLLLESYGKMVMEIFLSCTGANIRT